MHAGIGSIVRSQLIAVVAIVATFLTWQTVSARHAAAAASLCDGISGNLVVNCGFEQSAPTDEQPTGWSAIKATTGDSNEMVNGDTSVQPNSGTRYFSYGAADAYDTITQTLAGTTAGSTYRLTFYLQDASTRHEAQPGFVATVQNTNTGTTTALSLPNPAPGSGAWVQHTATFVATASAPTLSFAGQHGGGFFNLDDISVVKLPDPSPSPTATQTAEGTVVNPTITASLSSDHPKHYGWYRSPVTITFACAQGSAPLASPCPSPVTLSQNKAAGSITAKIAATDGGVGAVTVGPIKIDLDPPSSIHATPRKDSCTAIDALSGIRDCIVHRHLRNGVVHWTAIATDFAGNVLKTKGTYRR